jgi:hypothetical protein
VSARNIKGNSLNSTFDTQGAKMITIPVKLATPKLLSKSTTKVSIFWERKTKAKLELQWAKGQEEFKVIPLINPTATGTSIKVE